MNAVIAQLYMEGLCNSFASLDLDWEVGKGERLVTAHSLKDMLTIKVSHDCTLPVKSTTNLHCISPFLFTVPKQ